MRPILLRFALIFALATSLFAAPVGTRAKEAPVKPRLELNPELREFRKTAIPVQFPSSGLTLHGWIYKPQGNGPLPGRRLESRQRAGADRASGPGKVLYGSA